MSMSQGGGERGPEGEGEADSLHGLSHPGAPTTPFITPLNMKKTVQTSIKLLI